MTFYLVQIPECVVDATLDMLTRLGNSYSRITWPPEDRRPKAMPEDCPHCGQKVQAGVCCNCGEEYPRVDPVKSEPAPIAIGARFRVADVLADPALRKRLEGCKVGIWNGEDEGWFDRMGSALVKNKNDRFLYSAKDAIRWLTEINDDDGSDYLWVEIASLPKPAEPEPPGVATNTTAGTDTHLVGQRVTASNMVEAEDAGEPRFLCDALATDKNLEVSRQAMEKIKAIAGEGAKFTPQIPPRHVMCRKGKTPIIEPEPTDFERVYRAGHRYIEKDGSKYLCKVKDFFNGQPIDTSYHDPRCPKCRRDRRKAK